MAAKWIYFLIKVEAEAALTTSLSRTWLIVNKKHSDKNEYILKYPEQVPNWFNMDKAFT